MPTTAAKITRDQAASHAARIRETRPDDYNQIAALHRRNRLLIPPFEQWMSFWIGNPAYQPEQCPWGWVLETESGRIAGSIGNIPLHCEFQGRIVRTATAYGWVVDEDYRSYSVMILNRFIRQDGVDLFVFATVGDQAEPIYRNGLQLSRVPVGAWNRCAFWITNYRGFSRSVLAHHNLPGSLMFPTALGFSAWDTIRGKSIPRGLQGYQAEFCPAFDSRFDEFWDALRRDQPHRLLAVRSRETLEWHFQHNLASLRILTASVKSRIVACAICTRLDNPALELKRVRLVDFQALSGHGDALRTTLESLLRSCREDRVHVLEVMGSWLSRPDLPRIAAPYQRTLSSWTYYYKAADPDLAQALRDPNAWAPSSFDGDASL